jgi:shikimate dehydrogenase
MVDQAVKLPELFALFGQPVAGNPTQEMIEAAFRARGLNWRYLTIEVAPEELEDAILGMRAMGFLGVNITKPHKIKVIPYLDRLTEAAAKIGAVNCIKLEKQELLGENTDGKGFLESLQTVIEPAGKQVVLLGAGGAARAIGVELALAGVKQIAVVNRDHNRGVELARLLSEDLGTNAQYIHWDGTYLVPSSTDILINATSVGMDDAYAQLPLDMKELREGTISADVVFNPADTLFLRQARSAGCTTLDGLGMLVNQGVIGFRLWTGLEPDKDAMRVAMEEALGS